MFKNPSLIMRITYGKTLGFVLAGGMFLLFPNIIPEMTTAYKWGFVFYYTVIGAMIGLTGVMTYVPMIEIPLPWWFRGPWIGGWMGFILMLFIYDEIGAMLIGFFGDGTFLSSPLWLIVDAALFGLLTDFVCTKFAGEGPDCVINDNQ